MRNEDAFVLVEASKLSLEDEFMQYESSFEQVKAFKEMLCEVIQKGISDFYIPKYSPSFNATGDGIVFESGKQPAVGKTPNWWMMIAKEFAPNRRSRLGKKSEYVAFLGVLIKSLIDNGWGIGTAWHAVCIDSKELGHYWNSDDTEHEYEATGSRGVCGFFDLGNVVKTLADDDNNGFWQVGGDYRAYSLKHPLADFFHIPCVHGNHVGWTNAVGWTVLEK